MTERSRLSVLLLCDDHRSHASTVLEHIRAFVDLSRHDVRVYNPRGVSRSRMLRLEDFDVVVIHYSLTVLSYHHLSQEFRRDIKNYDGLKIQYVQDDYRQVDHVSQAILELGIDVLFTLVPDREIASVWRALLPKVRVVNTLAGYVSSAAAGFPSRPTRDRPLDVVYRGRALPYWLGALAQEKAWIAQEFLARSRDAGLAVDIGWRESDRIYGQSWFEFIASSRATLGTESGASITDFDGTLQARVEERVRVDPHVDFATVHAEILAPYEGNVRMNVISPRIFEAIALRTALVLFPGEYSGVLEPERHFIVLEKDFGNFREVARQIRDDRHIEDLVARAHEDIVESGRFGFGAMVAQFDAVLDELGGGRSGASRARYRLARLEHPFGDRLPNGARRRRLLVGAPKDAVRAGVLAVSDAAVWASDVEARTFGRRAVATRRFRSPERLRRLEHDLVRLAIVRRAHRGRLTAGKPFAVQVELRPEHGELVLRSVRDDQWRSPVLDASVLLEELGNRIRRITWDHSEIGDHFEVPVTRWKWAGVAVGFENVAAAHEFKTLVDVPSDMQPEVAALLAPLLDAPGRQERAIPLRPPPLPLPLRMLVGSNAYLRTLVPLVFRRPGLRALFAAARESSELRGALSSLHLFVELTKLALLAEASQGRLPGITGLAVSRPDDQTLVFKTVVEPEPVREPLPGPVWGDARITRMLWDNSALGTHVEYPREDGRVYRFAVGDDGVYRFQALAALMSRAPALVWAALDES